jgi:hypothetical protein
MEELSQKDQFISTMLLLTALLSIAAPVPLIIDTDSGFDVDDVGAVCLANALMDAGASQLFFASHTPPPFEQPFPTGPEAPHQWTIRGWQPFLHTHYHSLLLR